MIILALIPAAALLLIIALCLSAKHHYTVQCQAIKQQAEQQRQTKLNLDIDNDRRIIQSVVAGKKTLGELLSDYNTDRAAILPEVKHKDPSHWTNDDLINWIKRWIFSLSVKASRRILFRTALYILLVTGASVSLAAWRYAAISHQQAPQSSSASMAPDDDPFADTSTPTQ